MDAKRRNVDEWSTWHALSEIATPGSLGGVDPTKNRCEPENWARSSKCCEAKNPVDITGGVILGSGQTAGFSVSADTYANRPAASVAGRLYLPTDSAEIDRDNGSSWAKWGPIYPMTRAPTASNWSWVNQGSATRTDSAPGLYIANQTTTNGNNMACLVRSLPTNKTVIAHVSIVLGGAGTPTAGVVWRQSSTGGLVAIGMYASSTAGLVLSQKMTSPTAWSANYFQFAAFNPMNFWVKLLVNVNNRITYFSPDGQNWLQVHSIGGTDWITADQVGVYVDAYNAPAGMLVDSWVES